VRVAPVVKFFIGVARGCRLCTPKHDLNFNLMTGTRFGIFAAATL